MAATGIRNRIRAFLPGGRGKPLETRASGSTGFTDLTIAGLLARAAGDTVGDAAATAAVEACSLLWSAALAGAEVEGNALVKAAVDRRYLASVGRSWIRRGEAVHLIDVGERGIELLPCATWDVNGGAAPSGWWYRVDVFAPSSVDTRRVPRAAVAHSQWAWHEEAPWHGVAPWRRANLSSSLLSAVEANLAGEAGGPSFKLIPTPDVAGDVDPADDDALSAFRKQLGSMKGTSGGGVAMAPTMSGGFGAGNSEKPDADWGVKHVRPDPAQAMPAVREQAEQAVIAACGVPPSLILGQTDGTLQREAWRRFVMCAVQSKADELADVLSEALDSPVRFRFGSLWAHDLAGRAAAYGKMIQAEMPPAEAMKLAGLTDL